MRSGELYASGMLERRDFDLLIDLFDLENTVYPNFGICGVTLSST